MLMRFRIGELYERARLSLVDSVKYQIECGRALASKKESLPHGGWLQWLEANELTLGFGPKTAPRLMKLAGKYLVDEISDETEALQISRETWGNNAPRVTYNSGDNEWFTPPQYIEMARGVLGQIDLDPASCKASQKTVRAKYWYSAEIDRLKQQWKGRVWMNPPYAQPLIGRFITKLCDELSADNVVEAIVLVNNSTDTAWFHEAAEIAQALFHSRADSVRRSKRRGGWLPHSGPGLLLLRRECGQVCPGLQGHRLCDLEKRNRRRCERRRLLIHNPTRKIDRSELSMPATELGGKSNRPAARIA
jgi:ParB family chromosome partitioning protein